MAAAIAAAITAIAAATVAIAAIPDAATAAAGGGLVVPSQRLEGLVVPSPRLGGLVVPSQRLEGRIHPPDSLGRDEWRVRLLGRRLCCRSRRRLGPLRCCTLLAGGPRCCGW